MQGRGSRLTCAQIEQETPRTAVSLENLLSKGLPGNAGELVLRSAGASQLEAAVTVPL
jgi:hypothetical protein